ncbi:MAG: phosphoribosylamine--glycine ligase [Balneolaceae bacterium]
MKNLLVIGSGSREHAIMIKAMESNCQFNRGYKLHGFGPTANPGIIELCEQSGGSYTIGSVTEPHLILLACKKANISLVVIGPEAPLEAAVVDTLKEHKIKVVGPIQKLAQIETSKSFTRDFLATFLSEASPKYYVVKNIEQATKVIKELKDAYVIKADGLSGGKGVLIAQEHLFNDEMAIAHCEKLFKDSPQFVIEEKLIGQEFSLITLTDGKSFIHLPALQDHKRAYEDDAGPNTGGMGSYTDIGGGLPFLSEAELEKAKSYNELVVKKLSEIDGVLYQGVLYGGYMVCSDDVKIIEYNARFGDPEAVNLMYLIESDVIELFERIANGTLDKYKLKLNNQATVCTYVVPNNYPNVSKNKERVEIGAIDNDVMLCFGSIEKQGDFYYSQNSRTLALVAGGPSISAARDKIVKSICQIKGKVRYRLDIGSPLLIQKRVSHMQYLRRPLKIAVLGSTNGTDLVPIIEAINKKQLNGEIAIVLSDNKESGILQKAKRYNLKHAVLKEKGLKRDQEICYYCEKEQVELIILIGFMRILKKEFCKKWKNRIINVHPSLLPDFANTTDTNTHELAIKRFIETGNNITGCTIHLVTPEIDGGPIILQKECHIEKDDTPISLKQKVQALEGVALCECIAKAFLTRGDLSRFATQ